MMKNLKIIKSILLLIAKLVNIQYNKYNYYIINKSYWIVDFRQNGVLVVKHVNINIEWNIIKQIPIISSVNIHIKYKSEIEL